jgi:predicted ATP-grasp superfamily ATP-dependent carboligase
MRGYAERLFSKIGWHGVAMVEFKRCQDTGIPYLMEVNGRFWGSLQLAIDAGIDFPYLLCQLAAKREVSFPKTYQVGIKSRWLLGDLDNLYLTLFSNGISPFKVSTRDKLKAIYEFCKLFKKDTHFEILSLKDPNPFLFELRQYLKDLSIFR